MPSVEEVCYATEGEALMYQRRIAGKTREEMDLYSASAYSADVLTDSAYRYYLPFLLLVEDPRTGRMGLDPERIDLTVEGLARRSGKPVWEVLTPEQLNVVALYVLSFALEEDEEQMSDMFRTSRPAYDEFWRRFALTSEVFEGHAS